jgi:hypothetical protein
MDNFAEARLSPKFKAVQTASFGDDSGVHAQFDDHFEHNEYKSAQEGRAVYDHYFCVELQWPGDNTKTFKCKFPIHQTKNEWIDRFPRQWEAFRNSTQQVSEGTPIELWPPLDKKRVFELKASKIFTIEQIAAVKDTDLQIALGLEGRKMRDQAVAFLNPNASVAQVSRLQRENEDLQRSQDIMKQQIASLMNGRSLPENVENIPTPKRRGRKPKSETQAA